VGPFVGGIDDLSHALEPKGGAGGTLAWARERAAGSVVWEGEFQLCDHNFSFHAKNYEGPPTTSDVVGGKKSENTFKP
jgi:hypothetical protein